MKRIAFVLACLCACSSAKAAYLTTVFQDPTHPKFAASVLYTSKFTVDGGETDLATVFHKADPHETLLPQRALDLGVKPISWTLLELGAGGNTRTGFASAGPGVYVGQTVLGPVVKILDALGGNYKTVGDLLVSPDGSGIRIGIHWKANVLDNGGFVRFNQMRFPPRYVLGYGYQF